MKRLLILLLLSNPATAADNFRFIPPDVPIVDDRAFRAFEKMHRETYGILLEIKKQQEESRRKLEAMRGTKPMLKGVPNREWL